MVPKAKANQLRIIGGQWRGRKLSFADGDGLRPTMDRVRETLFNWLQNEIVGARCLDMFTGSGALGLEALSRYAGEVVMIDKNPQAIRMIGNNLKLLGADNAQLLKMDARAYLAGIEGSLLQCAEGSSLQIAEGSTPSKTFDIVFLDPPFNKQLVGPFCQLLDKADCLSDQASIYIEIEKKTALPELPKNWEVVKQKKAGQLAYYLVHVDK
ncbi:MAG: 16S rRNA (guanine(966)-N(2))-methyltransferase RsmD [Gammaproteobacteria bacterium]|nr:16S rRNA (guanine(966)-N(2))-methyltransferase RsmD [Gammaproteobacteria bacterium]